MDLGDPAVADEPRPDGGLDQNEVTALFDRNSWWWDAVYDAETLDGLVYRTRTEVALRWLDDLDLPRGSRIVDVGCGAGRLANAIASRGHEVVGVDPSPSMLAGALRHRQEADRSGRVALFAGDAHALGLGSQTCCVVVGLGVVPWLHDPARALRELARVIETGGFVLLTSDNAQRLAEMLDPRKLPIPPKVRSALRRWWNDRLNLAAQPAPAERRYRPRDFAQLLRDAGFEVLRQTTIGFGPFTLLGRPILSDAAGRRVQRFLQARADRGAPVLRWLGNHQVVLATLPRDQRL